MYLRTSVVNIQNPNGILFKFIIDRSLILTIIYKSCNNNIFQGKSTLKGNCSSSLFNHNIFQAYGLKSAPARLTDDDTLLSGCLSLAYASFFIRLNTRRKSYDLEKHTCYLVLSTTAKWILLLKEK